MSDGAEGFLARAELMPDDAEDFPTRAELMLGDATRFPASAERMQIGVGRIKGNSLDLLLSQKAATQ